MIKSASLAVPAIGQGLAQVQGTRSKHGVPQVVGSREQLVVALDWTSFAADGQATLALSMLTGHGRAPPLLWRTVHSATLKGQQSHYADELLQQLRETIPVEVRVTIVADRGCADCKLLRYLAEALKFD